ncbi:MAG: hypothetical protein Q8L37_00295 [Candidatus Gottesmanbacteria bacterium]|nr:hypothetical protein [Candidatus Gottesmanbacteria bacterium]
MAIEALPEIIQGIPLCPSYIVFCRGDVHLEIQSADGGVTDSALAIVKCPDDAVLMNGAVDCSRVSCHWRDASGVIQRQVGSWQIRLD